MAIYEVISLNSLLLLLVFYIYGVPIFVGCLFTVLTVYMYMYDCYACEFGTGKNRIIA